MPENINLALQLLFIGMLSVFVILAVVVYLGKFLIYFVNKLYPESNINKARIKTQAISNKKIALLTSVVDNITQGQGIIKSISKS